MQAARAFQRAHGGETKLSSFAICTGKNRNPDVQNPDTGCKNGAVADCLEPFYRTMRRSIYSRQQGKEKRKYTPGSYQQMTHPANESGSTRKPFDAAASRNLSFGCPVHSNRRIVESLYSGCLSGENTYSPADFFALRFASLPVRACRRNAFGHR